MTGATMARQARGRFWTPDCEAAPAINTTLTNDDNEVSFKARRPEKSEDYAESTGEAPSSHRDVTGEGLEWSPPEMLVFLACMDALWEQAEFIEAKSTRNYPSKPGVKSEHSEFEPLLYNAGVLMVELGYRAVGRLLGDKQLWNRIAEAVERTYPNHPNRRLTKTPFSRSRYYWHRREHWDETIIEESEAVIERAFWEAINYMGGLDPKAGSISHPDNTQKITGDGTWMPSLYQASPKDRAAAAEKGITVLCDDKATNYHYEESNSKSRGYMAVMGEWHSGHRQERIVPFIDFVPKGKTDATLFVERIRKAKIEYPESTAGLYIAPYDMRASSENADDLLDIGVNPITKLPRTTGGGLSSANLGEHTFTLRAGTAKHPRQEKRRVFAMDGPPVIELVDANGHIHYEPLERKQTVVRRHARKCTWYSKFVVRDRPLVPSHLVGATTLVCHNSTKAERDAKPHRRRTRALRIISEFDPDFDRLYGCRQGSESSNSHLKSTLWHGRARAGSSLGMRMYLQSYQMRMVVTALVAYHRRTGASLKGWFGDHPPPYRGDPTY